MVEQEKAEPLFWFLVINARSTYYDRVGRFVEAKDGRITLAFDGVLVEFEGWEVTPFYVS